MNHTLDPNLEPPSGQPSSQQSAESNTTNDMEPSPHDQLHRLEVAKAQVALTEASVKVQIAKERLEEAKQDKLSSQMMNLPHRTLPLKIYNDGVSWVAVYVCSEGEPLVGRADTPQLALADFDHQWLGLK